MATTGRVADSRRGTSRASPATQTAPRSTPAQAMACGLVQMPVGTGINRRNRRRGGHCARCRPIPARCRLRRGVRRDGRERRSVAKRRLRLGLGEDRPRPPKPCLHRARRLYEAARGLRRNRGCGSHGVKRPEHRLGSSWSQSTRRRLDGRPERDRVPGACTAPGGSSSDAVTSASSGPGRIRDSPQPA